jgi:muramoyltetrapeptide carboxypeptidase
VQALQGGYGSAQTIPLLDFGVIERNPKPFVGYSDITALHTAIRRRVGMPTFYGVGLMGVGDKETKDFTRDRLLAVLGGDATGEVPRDPDDPYVRAIRGGRVTAPLVGGCLWLLLQTMGTPWEIDLAGSIFFFEDVDAPPWYLDGMLTQLRHAGKLDEVVGVVVGEMVKCDWNEQRPEWPRTKSLEDVLEEHLEPLHVPVIYKLPLGHGKHLATLPLGVTCTLDADARTLTVDESPFA